jgi:hypothetical protein
MLDGGREGVPQGTDESWRASHGKAGVELVDCMNVGFGESIVLEEGGNGYSVFLGVEVDEGEGGGKSITLLQLSVETAYRLPLQGF